MLSPSRSQLAANRPDDIELFRARPDGPAQRAGRALERARPVGAGAIVAATGGIALTVAMIALGTLLVHVVARSSIGHWDDSVERWFAAHRSPMPDDLSLIGSWLAETLTVIAIGLVLAVCLAIRHLWRVLGLLITSLLVEVTTYVLVTLFVHRHRPFVEELERRRPFASFPSGHTAAAVALYFSVVVIVAVMTHNRAARALAWVMLVVAPVVVAISRLYRGMHHPTDVMAGYLMGIGCVAVAVFAVRVATVVAARNPSTARVASSRNPDQTPGALARIPTARAHCVAPFLGAHGDVDMDNGDIDVDVSAASTSTPAPRSNTSGDV
jgi:membrane-associated phospholipid phosphatase